MYLISSELPEFCRRYYNWSLLFLDTVHIHWDGRIVILCRIPDSVNRRLISGQFWIRIRIFYVTLPLVYTYKNYSKLRPVPLFFCNL